MLSLLLLLLVAAGLLMGAEMVEKFVDAPPAPAPATVAASPVLANMVATPVVAPTLQVNKLERDKDIVEVAHATSLKALQAEKPECPACPKCPDMSQYIRLDEVPCWNCTLP